MPQPKNRGQNQKFKQNNMKQIDADDSSNPIIAAFKEYAIELDDKHDRAERIIKLGRDITIESKRIIFLLHTIDSNKNNKDKVLIEAEGRLKTVYTKNFLQIAKELANRDPYQYQRAYSAGLQEFIEAYSYYEYLNGTKLSGWEDIQKQLCYEVEKKQPMENVAVTDGNETDEEKAENIEIVKENFVCHVEPTEFVLGLTDLTGELMRRCINSLGSGDVDTCFQCCRCLQAFYTSFIGLNAGNRELSRKISTLRQSLLKTENVCYNVKVRGGEAAKWGTTVGVIHQEELDNEFF